MKPSFPLFATALLVGILTLGTPSLHAQDKKNLVRNGSFESSSSRENLWDGVDASLSIRFLPRDKSILVAGKSEQPRTFPPSIAFKDMDGDKLEDMVITDASGFFYFFRNLGPKDNPKFAAAEMIPVFFDAGGDLVITPKIWVGPWRGTLNDIIFGDYLGRIVYLQNRGSTSMPDFRMPKDMTGFDLGSTKEQILIGTGPNGRLWGNFFAPFVYDWNKDGKKDLIIGEGTYSANAVHLFLNIGSDSDPKFEDTPKNHLILAYGYGREQLVPQVADWDGDGNMDLIVGCREGIRDSAGTIALYKGKPVMPGQSSISQLDFTENITIGGKEYNVPMAAPCIADFNGDGLLDILIASPSDGRVKIALNEGSKTAPQLKSLENVKAGEGQDALPRYKAPSNWNFSSDTSSPANVNPINQYAIVECVTDDPEKKESSEFDDKARPVEGKYALKISYPRPPLKYFKDNFLIPEKDRSLDRPGKFLALNTPINVILGKTYEFSFNVKGNKMTGQWNITTGGIAVDETPNPRNPKVMDAVIEYVNHSSTPIKFTVGSDWKKVSATITLKVPQPKRPSFKYPDGKTGMEKFNYKGNPIPGSINFDFAGLGEVYIDDVQLIEK